MFSSIQSAAIPAVPATPSRGAGPATPATPAVPPVRNVPGEFSQEGRDVLDAIERARSEVENDLDYQILRQTLRFMKGDVFGDEERPAPQAVQDTPVTAPPAATATAGAQQPTSGFSLDFVHESTTVVRVDIEGRDESGEFRVRFEAIRHERTSLSINASQQPQQQADPLILDLDGNGIQTTGIENGVLFDMTGDGRKERTSFVSGNDAFLALDRNGNGGIDDGRELFGDQHGASNGFEELAGFDENGDGRIDAGDGIFTQLRLFSLNPDGSQNLRMLDEAGISAIHLDYRNAAIDLNRDDRLAQTGSYERDDGSTGLAGDVLLGYRAVA